MACWYAFRLARGAEAMANDTTREIAMTKLRMISLIAIGGGLVVLSAITLIFLEGSDRPRVPMPDSVTDVLRRENELIKRAQAGDSTAALDLSQAYSFSEPPGSNKPEKILRLVVANGDRNVETQLGQILMNKVLRDMRNGQRPSDSVRSEAVMLLESAAGKGSKEADGYLQTYIIMEKKARHD